MIFKFLKIKKALKEDNKILQLNVGLSGLKISWKTNITCKIQALSGETWGEKNKHLNDLVLGGRILLKWIFNKEDAGLDWIYLAEDRDKWRVLVNTEMNFRVP